MFVLLLREGIRPVVVCGAPSEWSVIQNEQKSYFAHATEVVLRPNGCRTVKIRTTAAEATKLHAQIVLSSIVSSHFEALIVALQNDRQISYIICSENKRRNERSELTILTQLPMLLCVVQTFFGI